MSVMTRAAPVRINRMTAMELMWVRFLGELHPWEIHKLHRVGELELHDAFVNSNMDADEVLAAICRDGDEETYTQRVGDSYGESSES